VPDSLEHSNEQWNSIKDGESLDSRMIYEILKDFVTCSYILIQTDCRRRYGFPYERKDSINEFRVCIMKY
jgi:hypothetical protein